MERIRTLSRPHGRPRVRSGNGQWYSGTGTWELARYKYRYRHKVFQKYLGTGTGTGTFHDANAKNQIYTVISYPLTCLCFFLYFFVPHLSEGNKGDYKMLSVRPSFCLSGPCGCCNSTTTGPIHSKSSSLELSWPVDVQRHGHLPIWHAHGRNKRSWNLADARTQEPN